MTENQNHPNAAGADQDIDDIGKLIRFAGERETVDDARWSQARTRVHAHWRDVAAVEARRRSRTRLARLALAASVLLTSGLGLVFWQSNQTAGVVQPFSVQQVAGDVRADGRAAGVGDVFLPGVTLESGTVGRVAVALPGGQSIRLDRNSRLLLSASNRLELLQGAVYVDTGPGAEDASIAVETRFGTAVDIGTQYQVRLDDEGLMVGVREGKVELSRPRSEVLEIDSGYLFDVTPDGAARGRQVAGNDPVWQWTATVAPTFALEGATLEEYLIWYARESGLELHWSTPQSRTIARRDKLSGSIAGLSVADSLRLVQRIAPFEARTVGSVLEVAVQ